MIKIAFLTASCLSLSGCFWGFFGASVKVENETDLTIYVDTTGTDSASISMDAEFNDMAFYEGRRWDDIDSEESNYYGFPEFTFNPDMEIKYNGQTKKYKTNLDFFGFDTIYVTPVDYLRYPQ